MMEDEVMYACEDGGSASVQPRRALPRRGKNDHLAGAKRKRPAAPELIKRAKGSLKRLWTNDLMRILSIIIAVIMFTSVFMMIVEKDSGMYNPDIDTSVVKRFISSVYYSLVTISTSGYGDYTPRTMTGRIFTIFFLMFTIVSVAILSASITSIFVEKRLKEGWGMGNMSDMADHFIICGWKEHMAQILTTMLVGSNIFEPKDVVIIANVDPELLDDMKTQNPYLNDVRFVRGDYYNEVILNKANIKAAKQIFILADESDEKSSISEIDSKTVMAAMTINALNREIRVCAELLDMKYERYLLGAHVDEIIYTNEYSRLILAISSDSAAISRVVNDILDMNTEARILTCPFPEEMVGKPYYDLRVYFSEQIGANLIGLVENVGSLHKQKKEALREAQKTADISQLVDNLRKVKTIISNKPNIHPDDDYVVPKNAIAIIINRGAVANGMENKA